MLILELSWGPTDESKIIYQESKVVKCLLNLLFLTLIHCDTGAVVPLDVVLQPHLKIL